MPVTAPVLSADFACPDTLDEVLRRVAAGARVLAGGTDLYPGAGTELAGPVVDVTGVASLSGISMSNVVGAARMLRIGAATSWAALIAADLPPALRALQQAARCVGGRQIQVVGTLGGNLCNASPAADGVPPLLALAAEVELQSLAGARRLPLSDFLTGPRQTALRPGEMLTAVLITEAGLAGRSAFVKLGARSHLVISIAMVAARVLVKDGRISQVAIAVGACSPVAVRLSAVEAALVGSTPDVARSRISATDVAEGLAPLDDVRATAGYRRHAAAELVARAVDEAVA